MVHQRREGRVAASIAGRPVSERELLLTARDYRGP